MTDVITEILSSIPDYKNFSTLEELEETTNRLAEEFPNLVRVRVIGKSREGRTIRALEIGEREQVAFWFGCPHPNEPIGTLTLDYLSWKLAESEELRQLLGFKWVVVKVADPDGLKLNEGWLKGPFNLLHYALNYYRPAGNKQVEWSFPIEYKRLKFDSPIPETQALMEVISSENPVFIYSLHNAGFGGVYYYISEEAPLLYPVYWYFPRAEGIPLSLGEPEVPWAKLLARAVYYMVSTPEYYNFIEEYTDMDPLEVIKTGTDSYDFARRFNPRVFELVTEVPYFYDSRIEDINPSGENRRNVILESIEYGMEVLEYVSRIYDRVKGRLKGSGRLRESVEYVLETMPKTLEAEKSWALKSKEVDREATIAEVFDSRYVSRFYRLLMLGMLYRLLREEGLEEAEEVRNRMEELASQLERELRYRVIPIKKLVKIQLAAGLYTALYVRCTRKG